MPDLTIPDVSEYQNVDFTMFSGPIIVRAHNGHRVDKHWTAHAQGASQQPWWAAYQYLPGDVDPPVAARAFLAALGDYRPACTILDLEEGDGDQQARQHAWLEVMAGDPARDWTYSGDYFARAHGVDVQWIAAYQSREPSTAHRLWQFSDAVNFPGIGNCDASVFHGTVADLVKLTAAPQPSPPQEDDDMIFGTVNHPTRGELVYVVGIDQQTWEHSPKGGWNAVPGAKWSGAGDAQLNADGTVTLFGRGTEAHLWNQIVDEHGKQKSANDYGGLIFPKP